MKKILSIVLITIFGCSKSDLQLITVDASDIHKQVASHNGYEADLLNFWATTCSPCLEEFPMIVELSDAYKDKGIKVYFITTDWLDFEKEAITFLNKQGVKGISFIKEEGNDNNFINAISQEWSGTLPFTIVYDRYGNVSDYWEMKKDRFRFESAIIKAIGS